MREIGAERGVLRTIRETLNVSSQVRHFVFYFQWYSSQSKQTTHQNTKTKTAMEKLKETVRQLERKLVTKDAELQLLQNRLLTLDSPQRQFNNRKLTIEKVVVDEADKDIKFYHSLQHPVFYNERDWRMITVHISLRNEDGTIVKGKSTPLASDLLYSDNSPVVLKEVTLKPKRYQKKVKKRKILTMHSHMEIGANGTAELNFRIEDSSVHHENRLFCIQLSAEGNKYITPVQTEPIEVKTKHPKDRVPRKKSDTQSACGKRTRDEDRSSEADENAPKLERKLSHCDCFVCRRIEFGTCEITGREYYGPNGIDQEKVFGPRMMAPNHTARTVIPFTSEPPPLVGSQDSLGQVDSFGNLDSVIYGGGFSGGGFSFCSFTTTTR